MESKNVLLILFAFAAFRMAKTGIMPMFEVIQDDFIIEKNDLTEYLKLHSNISGAGTLDAILNMDVEVLKTLPEDFRIKLKLERQSSSGDFVTTGVNIDQEYCEFIKNDKLLLPLVTKFGNFASKCPIEAGHYYLRNVTLKGHQLPLAVPLGTYRGIFRYSVADKEAVILWKARFVRV